MSSVTRYAAVNTKIRALEGKLLKNHDYLALMSKRSVAQIAQYLKEKTHYKDALRDVDPQNIHRGRLEVILKKNLLDNLNKVTYYFHGNHSRFVEGLFMRYEIEDLKILIRAVYTDRDFTNFKDSLVYIGRYSSIDYKALAGANTFAQLIDALKGTEYYRYLLPLKGKEQQEGQFGIEMALDLAYFSLFERHIKLLPKKEQIILKKIMGMQADLLNLQWIYRGLKFYKLPPEELLNYTINFGSRLKYKDIKALCYSKDTDELEHRMLNTRYKFLFTHGLTKDIFVERRILRYQYLKLMELRRKGEMNISQTIIYFHLLECEIRDIISVIEAIRYSIDDVQQIKRYLIRKI